MQQNMQKFTVFLSGFFHYSLTFYFISLDTLQLDIVLEIKATALQSDLHSKIWSQIPWSFNNKHILQ